MIGKSSFIRNRLLAAVGFSLAAMLWFGALAGPGEAASAAKPPILSASEIDYPPFSIVEASGRADGFAVELLRAALKAMGREATFRIGPWAQVRGWLEKGEVQALPLVGRTPERESIFEFTFPYMSLHGAIVVRSGTKDIRNLSDLAGRRVAVMKGDNAEEFLQRQDRGIEIHATATFEEALRELSEGRYDAVIVQRLVALRLIQETGLTNLQIVNRPIEGFKQDFCFAVQEGDRETLALLNEGLALVMADGTYRQLYARWFAALELPSDRRMVIGGDYNYPPYEYMDGNGRPAGYNVELTRAIAREVGLEIEIRLGPWTEIIQGLEGGAIDAVQGMFYSAKRDLKFEFSQPHTVNHCVSVTRKGAYVPPATVAELAGKRLVVQRGDIMHDFMVKNGLESQVSAVDSQEVALKELAEGQHDVALVSRLTALYWIEEYGWDNLSVGRQPLLSPEYCYAVPGNHKALLAQFSEGLKVLEKSGEYRRIHKKWMGVYGEAPPRFAAILRYVAMASAPLLLLLSAFFLWSWSLRKQVAIRTSELRQSETLLTAIVDAIAAPVFYKNAQGAYLGCNQAFARFLGLPKESIIGRTVFEIFPIDLARQYHDADSTLIKDGNVQVYETEAVDRSGNRRQVILHKSPFRAPDGTVKGIVGAMLDISERKLAEAALKERNAFIRTVLDNLPIGIAVNSVNPAVKFDYMNDNFPKFYRTTREAIADPDTFWDAVYEEPEFRQVIRRRVLEDCASGDPERMHWADVPIARQGGETAFITARNIPISDKNLMISVVWDVSERKQTEEHITHLNRVLRAIRDVNQLIIHQRERDTLIREGCRLLVDHRGYSSALIVLTDENDRPVSWAEAGMGAAFGPLAAILEQGQLPPCCVHSRSSEGVLLVDDRQNVCGECPFSVHCIESHTLCVRLIHDGVSYGYLAADIEHRMSVDDDEQTLFAEMAGDLAYALNVLQMKKAREASERKRVSLEGQLLQAQKMESVGRLAGGVAHDYNNMLSVIIGYAELAIEEVEPGDALHADLKEILEAARRSSEITRQLLAFARKQTIAPRALDLNETVEGMLKMLRRLIGEDIDLAWLPEADLWPVKMDPAQIDQILANLCVNARDAIAGVGKVTIETHKVTFDEAYCADHAGFVPGEFILLAVSDDGCGMNKEALNKIFEPFFTTKDVGRGTGLGLATVYGIVKQNNGFINVYSELGKGSTFKIYLPRHAGQAEGLEAQGTAEIQLSRGETVLLVEDEPAIMRMGKMMLEKLGYRVLTAGKPSEAMRLVRERAGEIHLLFTDVIMPEMNGRDLADRLHSRYPDIKTLFMSGYTADVIAHRGLLEEGVNFIQKPFSMKDLASKVRAALA